MPASAPRLADLPAEFPIFPLTGALLRIDGHQDEDAPRQRHAS
jgi:hypothetical protein